MVSQRPETYEFHWPPRTIVGWIAAVLAAGTFIVIAIFAVTVFLALAAIGLVVAPLLLWWRRRSLPDADDRTVGRVLDVEYEVTRPRPPPPEE